MAEGEAKGQARGLLLDYGGVLTLPVGASFTAFERACGIEPGHSIELLRSASRTPGGGLIGALERGERSPQEFEEELARLLTEAGYQLPHRSLLAGLFEGMRPAGRLWGLARAARSAGVRTGLLSNSWGTDSYPRRLLADHFDEVVISGEVGLRKPEPEIYLVACERLGVAPSECAFVDDLERNVEAARQLGIFAVLHRGDDDEVVAAVAPVLGLDLEVVPAEPDAW